MLGQLPELKQSSRRTAQVSGDRAAGYPQPQFAIEHDKVGQDTRWYSNLYDGLTVECNQGGSGSYNLYVGTTSELPKNLNGATNYVVIVWAAPAS